MSNTEMEEQAKARRLEQAKTSERKAESASEGKKCPSCSRICDQEALFCEECGAKFESESQRCPACGEMTSGPFCSYCGAVINGEPCPSCGETAYGDFCPKCGTPVTRCGKEAAAPAQESLPRKEILSDAEVEKEKREILAELTPEMKAEIERTRQRIIMLREREYERERDERIDKYNNAQKGAEKKTSREESAFIKRAVERLSAQTKNETKRVDDILHQREEEEKRRKEEEERKRRLEQINGSWIHVATWGYCIMKFTSTGTALRGTTFIDCPKGQNLNKISGTFDGEQISFYVSGCSGSECENHAIMKFSGRLTDNIISGYMNYMSDREHGIFVRNG